MLKVFKDTAFYDSLESLFQKVKTTLPPESIKYLENVEQTLHMGMKPYKEYGKFKGILNRVNDAAVNRKSIEIVYYTMSRRKESRRLVDPYRIWFFVTRETKSGYSLLTASRCSIKQKRLLKSPKISTLRNSWGRASECIRENPYI